MTRLAPQPPHRAIAVVLALSASLMAAGCGNGGDVSLAALNPSDFPTAAAQRGAFEVTIEEVGIAEASKKMNVYAPYEGKVTYVAEDGKQVEKDEVLVRIDTEDLVKRVEDRLNDLRLVKSDVDGKVEQLRGQIRNSALDAEKSLANLDFERTRLLDLNHSVETLRMLAELALIAQTEVDSGESQWESRRLTAHVSDLTFRKDEKNSVSTEYLKREELSELGTRGAQQLRRVRELQSRIDAATLRTPADGMWVVGKNWSWQEGKIRPVTVGQEVHRGYNLGEITLSNDYVVLTQVPESLIARVAEDMPVRLSASALGTRKLAGRIMTIGNAAVTREQSPAGSLNQEQDLSGLKVFEVKVELKDDSGLLRNGMTVDVSIVTDRLDDTVSIPWRAVFRHEALPIVFVKTAKGIEQRPVVLGPRNADRVAILKGLEGTELVYLTNLNDEVAKLKAPKRAGMDL